MLTSFHDCSYLECPRCGKHAIAQESSSVYVCLNCGFRRNTSEPQLGESPVWLALILLILLLIFI